MRLILVIIYLSFISLGIPDSLLGSAWPSMHLDFQSTLAFAGVIFFSINIGTIFSSLFASGIIYKLGTSLVVLLSVMLSALTLYLFSITVNVWVLVALAIPFGLAAGCIDAALNNYVALNFQSKHMNYLHSFWGVGAATGPLILAMYLAQQQGWRLGYASVAILQFALALFILVTLSSWKRSNLKESNSTKNNEPKKFVSNTQALKIKGVKLQLFIMFCYCSLEACTGLWAASYFITQKALTIESAAFWVSMYFVGITIGRFISGFMTSYMNESTLVRTGLILIMIGGCLLFVPSPEIFSKLGLFIIGFGCAPIYPNVIHLTPEKFGQHNSQSIVGLSMAAAYTGTTFIAPLFGLIASQLSLAILPLALLTLCIFMIIYTEKLNRLPPHQN